MRKRYLVHGRYQIRWALTISFIGGVIAALLSALVWASLDEQDTLLVQAVRAERALQGASENIGILLANMPETAAEERGRLEARFAESRASVLAVQSASASRIELNRLTRWGLVGFVALVMVTLFAWGIVVTHRVAGPMVVMKRALEAYQAGAPVDLRPLRSRDEFQDVYDALARALGPHGRPD